jgi:hypothetical protein
VVTSRVRRLTLASSTGEHGSPSGRQMSSLQLIGGVGITVRRHDRRVLGLGNHPFSGDYPEPADLHAGGTNPRAAGHHPSAAGRGIRRVLTTPAGRVYQRIRPG